MLCKPGVEKVQQLLSTRKCQGCNLRDADLDKVNLNGVDLSNAILIDADWDKTNLSNANLSGADLTNADLGKTNLTKKRDASPWL